MYSLYGKDTRNQSDCVHQLKELHLQVLITSKYAMYLFVVFDHCAMVHLI